MKKDQCGGGWGGVCEVCAIKKRKINISKGQELLKNNLSDVKSLRVVQELMMYHFRYLKKKRSSIQAQVNQSSGGQPKGNSKSQIQLKPDSKEEEDFQGLFQLSF